MFFQMTCSTGCVHSENSVAWTTVPMYVPPGAGAMAISPLSNDQTPSMLELAAAEATPTSRSSVVIVSANNAERRRERCGLSQREGVIVLTNGGPA